MSVAISLRSTTARRSDATLSFVQHSLLVVGLMTLLGTFKPMLDDPAPFVPDHGLFMESPVVTDGPSNELVLPPEPPVEVLPPRLQRALDFVSRRYRVAPEALIPVFEAAQKVGRERRIDPLLIIAIIGIESRFNPFAESAVGAKGLMQVIPGYHLDKIPKGAGEQPFLDPVTNIQVGVHVLEEAIRWRGSLIAGLQHYGGAAEDPETEYANKVFAEKQRLEQAVRRGPGGRA